MRNVAFQLLDHHAQLGVLGVQAAVLVAQHLDHHVPGAQLGDTVRRLAAILAFAELAEFAAISAFPFPGSAAFDVPLLLRRRAALPLLRRQFRNLETIALDVPDLQSHFDAGFQPADEGDMLLVRMPASLIILPPVRADQNG
jgi:hypothetical protein